MDHASNLAILTLGTGGVLAVVAGYVIGGLVCIGIAATGFGGRSAGRRVFIGILGAACIIYAAYILFGDSDSVLIIWYVMLLPFIVLIRSIATAVNNRKATNAQAQAGYGNPAQPGYGNPAQAGGQGYGVPGQYPNHSAPAQSGGQHGGAAPAPAPAGHAAGGYPPGQPATPANGGAYGQQPAGTTGYGQPPQHNGAGQHQPSAPGGRYDQPTAQAPQGGQSYGTAPYQSAPPSGAHSAPTAPTAPRREPPPPPPADTDRPLWPGAGGRDTGQPTGS